jgi:DNA-binding NtrC family response regulator
MEQFVIVANNDQAVLVRAQDAIEQAGFVPVLAFDGKQMYKALRSDIDIAAVFLSLEMSYIPGIELIKFMKSDDRLKAVPVVLIDNKSDPVGLRQALAEGAVAAIPKPFNVVRFRSILLTVTGSSNERVIS